MRFERHFVCRQPWNALTVINKIMVTSLKAMVEFSREKYLNLNARQKPF